MNGFSESTVEDAVFTWFERLGWAVAHGPDFAPNAPDAERGDYGKVGRSPSSRLPPCQCA